MFLLAAFSVLALASAADPSDKSTFTDTHHLLWKDCGGHDAWIRLDKFDVTPSPLRLPGNGSLTIHATNTGRAFGEKVALRTFVKKRIGTVNRWKDVPCLGYMGTCQYGVDPCHFLSALFPGVNCPQTEFVDQRLPCTCPFSIAHGKSMRLNQKRVTFGTMLPRFWESPVNSQSGPGEYYIKLTMYESGQVQPEERMCLEFYVNLEASH